MTPLMYVVAIILLALIGSFFIALFMSGLKDCITTYWTAKTDHIIKVRGAMLYDSLDYDDDENAVPGTQEAPHAP